MGTPAGFEEALSFFVFSFLWELIRAGREAMLFLEREEFPLNHQNKFLGVTGSRMNTLTVISNYLFPWDLSNTIHYAH